jgi:hypothetical protein
LATGLPPALNRLEALLKNTPVQAAAEALLVQSGNQLVAEATNELNQQNQNLQNYGATQSVIIQ